MNKKFKVKQFDLGFSDQINVEKWLNDNYNSDGEFKIYTTAMHDNKLFIILDGNFKQ